MGKALPGFRRVGGAMAVVVALAMAGMPVQAASTLEISVDFHPDCYIGFNFPPFIGICLPASIVAVWHIRACSDREATFAWAVAHSGGSPSQGAVVLNGPPGNPLSVGSCHEVGGSGEGPLHDCVAVVAALAPSGEDVVPRELVKCRTTPGPSLDG